MLFTLGILTNTLFLSDYVSPKFNISVAIQSNNGNNHRDDK
jgi:hypothetical protein